MSWMLTRGVFFVDELMRDEKSTRINEVNLSQPSTVAIQLCLVDLLKSWCITPSAVTSHSSGEIAAAYTVGALSFKEALGVIYYRGQLALKLQKLGSVQGGMAAVGLGADGVEKYITDITTGGHVLAACINSPNSVTISGDLEALDEVVARLEKNDVFVRKLKVPLAYHSRHMSDIADEYTQHLQSILPETAKSWDDILFSSPVTGELVTSADLPPSHWARNLTSPVLFSQAFENMCFGESGLNVDMIVEIGAHSTLSGPIRQILKGKGVDLPYISCLKRPVDAVETMQELVCELLGRDYPVSLESVNFPLSGEKQTSTFVPDLPTYPWNHKIRYWQEPRVSRELRNRKLPPHELLGTQLTGGSNTPTWRNFFRLSEMEWLRDHQVESKIVLPGANYIAMAIEAVRLLTDPSEETIRGYRLRDVEIMNALVIPESSAVETHLSLRRCNTRELEHDGWYEFELVSLGANDFWVENCKGYVLAETGDAVKAATTREQTPPSEDSYFPSSEVRNIDVASLFTKLHEMGIQHGPVFQNLIESKATEGKGITKFKISDVASASHDYVLHPTTLDSIFQSTFCSLPEARASAEIVLPRSIRAMFVPKNLNRKGGEKLQAFTQLVSLNRRGLTSNVSVINTDRDDDAGGSFFQIQDFFCQAVPRDLDGEGPEELSMCAKATWELDILHNVPAAIKESMKIPMEESEIDLERKRVRASFYFIHDAVSELEAENPDTSTWTWNHKLYYDWMRSIVALADSGELREGSKAWSKTTKGMRQRLYDELEAASATDRLLVRVGQKIPAIVRGEVTTLELMMEGNLLNEYYSDNNATTTRVRKHGGALAELYAMKEPGAKILEIGAGTGGGTISLLEAFDARAKKEGFDGSLVGHYTFTDISQGFFAAAREKFADWEGMMDFKQLDIAEDPIAQGFEAGSYDMIGAVMVLHATKNLHTTLSHVRKLLKPGGKLVLVESTKDRLDTQVAFGPLPGWWMGEEPDRKTSPNVSIERWDQLLRETGFSGVDFDISDYEEPEFGSASTILSTAVSTEAVQGPISIVHDTTQTPSQLWLSQLCDQIRAETGISPTIESLDQVQAEGKICIFTAEMERPFVDGMDKPSFEKLRKLVTNSRGVLWLSSGSLVDSEVPSYAATQGFLRTLRFEDTSKRYVHLDFEQTLDGGNTWISDRIGHIVHVLQQSFKDSMDEESGIELEWAVKDSMLRVVRLIPDKAQSQLCGEGDVEPAPELQPFLQPGRPLQWQTSKSGLLSDLHFTDKLDLAEEVPSGFVEVEAFAFGMNFRDVLVALGQLDETFLAHELGGVIRRMGPDTEESGLQVGDRVCGASTGRYSSTSQGHWTSYVKIPDDMSFEWAATIPVGYSTAYHSLFHIARLQKGESVLVHAAAGGFGQAAVVLAQWKGAEVFATCSSETKRDLLAEQYDIPLDHILSSRDASFAPAIMALTNGKGVDVVVNSLAGALLKATWDCIARFGRFIEVGKIDMEASRRVDMTPFRRCATFASVDLMQLREYNRPLSHEALVESIKIIHGRGKPPALPITEFSISDVEKAMRLMQAGKHMGKLVLVPGTEDLVKVSPINPPPFVSLSPNANILYRSSQPCGQCP
jgi:acyl transferase domain-containing protein/NADPH:quinone reductase-like Zn-dependent oxidoreductase